MSCKLITICISSSWRVDNNKFKRLSIVAVAERQRWIFLKVSRGAVAVRWDPIWMRCGSGAVVFAILAWRCGSGAVARFLNDGGAAAADIPPPWTSLFLTKNIMVCSFVPIIQLCFRLFFKSFRTRNRVKWWYMNSDWNFCLEIARH